MEQRRSTQKFVQHRHGRADRDAESVEAAYSRCMAPQHGEGAIVWSAESNASFGRTNLELVRGLGAANGRCEEADGVVPDNSDFDVTWFDAKFRRPSEH